MARRTCPHCKEPCTLTGAGKIGKHRDGKGETCVAVGQVFTTAQKNARRDVLAARIKAMRERSLDSDLLDRIENGLKYRDFGLVERMLDAIEDRS
jgi:hypothetical protein